MTRPGPPARNPPPRPPKQASKPLPNKGIRQEFRAFMTPRPEAPSPPTQPPALAAAAEPLRERPARPGPELPSETPQPRPAAADVLDPMARALALPLGRGAEPPPPAPAPSPLGPPDEVLLDRLVKRLSWGGNGRRGSARIELGAGSLAGATLLVHAEGRELTLEIEGADPRAAQEFAARIGQRLGEKGIVLRQA